MLRVILSCLAARFRTGKPVSVRRNGNAGLPRIVFVLMTADLADVSLFKLMPSIMLGRAAVGVGAFPKMTRFVGGEDVKRMHMVFFFCGFVISASCANAGTRKIMLLIIHFRVNPEKRTIVLVACTVMIKAVGRRPFDAVLCS